jgi:hypothetical protein
MAHAMKTKLLRTVGALDLHESTEGNLYVTANGGTKVVGGAWGPAADNDNWFAWREPADPIRVADRHAAVEHITAPVEVVEP